MPRRAHPPTTTAPVCSRRQLAAPAPVPIFGRPWCDVAAPPERPGASARFRAQRDVDCLVLIDGLQGARGPIRLNWAVEEEVGGTTVALREGRLVVEMRVAPATYDWQSAEVLGAWRSVLRTNLSSGVFRFQDPDPAQGPARFFRLQPATP